LTTETPGGLSWPVKIIFPHCKRKHKKIKKITWEITAFGSLCLSIGVHKYFMKPMEYKVEVGLLHA
jgi:hypothetical protein